MIGVLSGMRTPPDRNNIYWTAGHQQGVCEGMLAAMSQCVSTKDVYVDVMYDGCSVDGKSIEVSCGRFHQQCLLLTGGKRCLSLRIPHAELSGSRSLTFRSQASFSVERVVIREDFYDFFGLRSHLQDDSQASGNEQEASRQGRLLDLMANFYMEWRCDYACTYCWQEADSSIFRGRARNRQEPHAWAAALNRLRPHEIHISGGEPLLYNDLPELVSLIDPRIRLSIHTNFGPAFKLKEWGTNVATDRFSLILLSYHPTQRGAASFFSKLEQLLGAGFKSVGVEMVLHPSNIPRAAVVLDRCRVLEIPVRFDPYVPPQVASGGRTEGLIAEMKLWIERARALCVDLGTGVFDSINYDMEQYWELSGKNDVDRVVSHTKQPPDAKERTNLGRLPIFCNAGSREIVIDPKGDVYVCSSALVRAKLFGPCSLPHYAPIGNVLEEDFRLLDKPLICWESFRCSGDQFQHLSPAWTLASDRVKPLPLPE
jgi:MoaA/NifB/PqqE/SkfB family radical SAM enzyme